MGNLLLNSQPSPNTDNYSRIYTPPTQSNMGIATSLGIPPPIRPGDETNSAKHYGFYHAGNMCWLLGMMLAGFVLMGLALGLDAGLTSSWSSQGSKRFNDRHVPVSSVWSKTLDLSTPTFTISWADGDSSSATPAIWGEAVFHVSHGGYILAHHQHTGEILWTKHICTDLYELDSSECEAHTLARRYMSLATPTVWGNNLVISVRKPADVLVVSRSDGSLISKKTLDDADHAELIQSGTVFDDSLYIGTSISRWDVGEETEDCDFIGRLFRLTLSDMQIAWVSRMDDPNGASPGSPSGFTGMPVRGSSPALSVEAGLVAITVGPATCTPEWFKECIGADDCADPEDAFDYHAYEHRYDNCYNSETAQRALFNSVAVFRISDGSLYWHEKLIGYRPWKLACLGFNKTNPCEGFIPSSAGPEACDFRHNPYANCPSEYASCRGDFDFVDDPVYQLHSRGEKTLYAMQQSGVVYAFDLMIDESRDASLGQFKWARQVRPLNGAGGLAVNMESVFFSVYHRKMLDGDLDDDDDAELPIFDSEPTVWTIGDNVTTLCGGWGALQTENGLPRWYSEHPMCGKSYGLCNMGRLSDNIHNGGRSAPSVTNDVVIVTSADTSRLDYRTLSVDDYVCGGFVYGLHAKSGKVLTAYETKEPFGLQGASIHDRCVYTGNGIRHKKPTTDEDDTETTDEDSRRDADESPIGAYNIYGWCVKSAFVDSAADHSPIH